MVLKTNQVVAIGSLIFLPELHNGIGPASRARVVKPHRLHRSKTQSIAATPGNLLNWQAPFKIRRLVFGNMRLVMLGFQQSIKKGIILLLVEGAIDVIVTAV